MNLTESQLFTIEALNRIDGFVWPEEAKFAGMCEEPFCVSFYSAMPVVSKKSDNSALFLDDEFIYVDFNHPDWRNSLITREEFESVDGWVRNAGCDPKSSRIDIRFDSGEGRACSISSKWNWVIDDPKATPERKITHWRYHKPTKESEMKDDEEFSLPISDVYLRYKAQRETTADARKALEASMEAEDKLLEQIKAWNLEYGFDIRVLDESDEKPEAESELAITDWRDLRVGDEIWWSGGAGFSSGQYIISEVSKKGVSVTTWKGQSWLDVLNTAWKFIRRP